ncbi:uncharacterized protein LY79DRAFT_118620 [Colletotrichum navitas]|uniref:Uncharacterized protein n=1 Tax=Colletotrichum navitas TaxID=681940 RepID=A0AAD8V6R0_9PEZI|nr:uncharacterized protein LY79DRAFT_118620 [Colletotrichum navitas]KAK1595084.1 hypothetical protein LY79DRAFT_118620 [Colletotrichum navitas]
MSLVSDTCYPEPDDEGKAWAKVASNVPDPPKCIETCRTRFLESVVPGFDKTRYPEACRALSNGQRATERLWEVYCCDSTSCGVQLNGNLGQDPSVNFIINTCQNIGSGIIQDPGPPPAGYACPMSSVSKPSNPCPKPFMMTDARGPVSTNTDSLAAPTPDSITITLSTSLVTGHLAQTTTSTMQTTGKVSNYSQYEEDRHAVLPTGAKAAIGAASGIAFLVILAFAICLLRRRTRGRATRIEITHRDVQEASLPTPLLSPSGSAHGAIHTPPLTPPPRLQERRLLPVSPSPGRPSIIITTPKSPLGAAVAQGGPLSKPPVSSLTSSRPSPGFDRSTKPYYRIPPPGVLAGGSPAGKTASMSSATSGRTATTVSSISSSFPALAPSSPTRPVRPCDKLLHVPDLVCPGPPPNRSLPSPPSRSPSRPVALPRNQQQHAESRSSGERVPPRQAAPGATPREESKHVHIPTETSTRESLEKGSWSSWGVGGGGAGIEVSSAQNEDGRMDSPVLEDAGLERIGDRC